MILQSLCPHFLSVPFCTTALSKMFSIDWSFLNVAETAFNLLNSSYFVSAKWFEAGGLWARYSSHLCFCFPAY